jgi:ketosteroid isomerase-like protein
MSAKANKDIINKVNEASIAGDTEAFLSYCADTIKWKMSGQAAIVGKNAVRNAMAAMEQEPPRISIEKIIAEKDTVMVQGEFEMKDPEGKNFKSAFCDVYTFQKEKIVELRSWFDNESDADKS